MTKKNVIIIGAGIGGLSTGVYAQINGYRSAIFESHSTYGGLAATWKRKEYFIDGGIHFLTGHKPHIDFYKILQEIGAQAYNFVDMKTYVRYFDEKTGIKIDITRDLPKLKDDLLHYFPSDRPIIDQMISGVIKLSKYDLSTFGFEKPVELLGITDKLQEYWSTKGLLKFFTGIYNQPVWKIAETAQSEVFADILRYLFLPDVPFWFIIMILSTLVTDQMCLLGKGSNEFVKCIETKYRDLGGKIHYKSTVKRILVDSGKAFGIELEDGQEIYADYVISAADGHSTIYEMLGGQFINPEIDKRYNPKRELPPYLCISYGISREFRDDPWLIFKKLQTPIRVGELDVFEFVYRIFNFSDYFAPKGKTVLQVMFETNWDYWENLKKNTADYKKVKKELAETVLHKLENIYPGVSEKVEVIDVATPYTYWRYTRSHKGSIMGFLPTADSMMKQFKKSLPGLDNFYLAGQWSMSVGGVPTAIFSGRHVIQLLCKKDKKPFKSIE